MREISCEEITNTISKLCFEAASVLPPSLAILLECAWESEPTKEGEAALGKIVENFKLAATERRPICCEAGIVTVFADVGQGVTITGGVLGDAVNEAVSFAGGEVNQKHQSRCVLHTRLVKGDKLEIQVAPIGFHVANADVTEFFPMFDNTECIEDFIIKTVNNLGEKPCRPLVLGVGLGGTSEQCALNAKRALLRNADKCNNDEFYAAMEWRLLEKLNRRKDGKSVLGGRQFAVAVNIEVAPPFSDGLFCAIKFGCHATRSAKAVL